MPSIHHLCNYSAVDMFYAYVAVREAASAFGPVRLAVTDRGIASVELLGTPEDFAAGLDRRGLVDDEARVAPATRALADHLSTTLEALLDGTAVDLDALPLDLDDRPAWDRLVLEGVRAIPRGSTASYGEIARRIGRPGAARAVGGAVGRNPVGLLIPCHRVIAGDGGLGGYGAAAWGGIEAALDLKSDLLRLEGVSVIGRRVSRR